MVIDITSLLCMKMREMAEKLQLELKAEKNEIRKVFYMQALSTIKEMMAEKCGGE